MQWDSHQYAGFSTVEPWLPISRDHQTRNVEQQNTDSKSLLNFYRHLLHLRRKTPALNKGSYKPIATGEDGCYAYLRSNSDEVYLVALNFTGQPMTPNIHALKGGRVILSTHLDREESLKGESLRLRANEAVVVALG
jgi:alpha-glucosidase